MLLKFFRYILFGICSLLIIQACNNSIVVEEGNIKNDQLFTTNLTGDWFCIIDSDTIYESWSKENDSTMKGISYTATGDEKVLEEIIQLKRTRGKWLYCPTIATQNDGKEVCFEYLSGDSTYMRFGNPLHDFPESIEYRFTHKQVLEASIRGKLNGQDTAIVFTLFKVPVF